MTTRWIVDDEDVYVNHYDQPLLGVVEIISVI